MRGDISSASTTHSGFAVTVGGGFHLQWVPVQSGQVPSYGLYMDSTDQGQSQLDTVVVAHTWLHTEKKLQVAAVLVGQQTHQYALRYV